MNLTLVKRLILYTIDQLQDRGGAISTIRIIKILYLIDLEYYSRHGVTLTEIDWIFHHFGPYFNDIDKTLRSLSIDIDTREVLTQSGRGFTFRSIDEQKLPEGLDFVTGQLINRVIKTWALEDTDALLKHVYATEPIKYGSRGQPLDFTYETDGLLLKKAIHTSTEFIPLEAILEKYSD